jgi:hypothetical protein
VLITPSLGVSNWPVIYIINTAPPVGGLGFRDIKLFNLALLARQAWRLMQDLNTLSACILKAVYYPSCDFLQEELGSTPSRVWRAIVEGKDVLKQGLVHQIGNGQSSHIWNMNWLPRDGLLLSELIDMNT